jgi:hypothetical protein
MADVMNGVKNVRRKFQDQLPAVAEEAEYDRTCKGNISPIATQIPGPQVDAYLTKLTSE